MRRRPRGGSDRHRHGSTSVLFTTALLTAASSFCSLLVMVMLMRATTTLAWRVGAATTTASSSSRSTALRSMSKPAFVIPLASSTSAGPNRRRFTTRSTTTTMMAAAAADGSSAGASGGGGGRASAAVKQDSKKRDDSTSKSKASKQEKLDLNPPKGTRDFYPEDMRLRNWLFDHWRDIAKEHNFEEYDAPVLESEALYVRKAGEEVTEQLYNFEDKGGRRVALRPEMTPSLARMVMSKRNGLVLPVKWFSIPQCWRYERMTRGRRREHFQWNMDVWGVAGVEAEAELLAAITTFFSRVGLTAQDVGIKVNSRGVLAEVLSSLGVPADKFAATCVLVDKLEKVPVDAIRGDLAALGLEESVVLRLLEVIKSPDIAALEKEIGNGSEALKQLRQLFDYAKAYGFEEWLVLDASVVRGLAYYTGVVFEAFDRKGELRAICGGGRYDKLLETFGGEALPAVGFGFGDAVIMELLEVKGLKPSVSLGIDAVVFAMESELQATAIGAASALRASGLTVDLQLEARKAKWGFKHADRLGASFVVLVGSGEAAEGKVQVKELSTGQQEAVTVAELGTWMVARQMQMEGGGE